MSNENQPRVTATLTDEQFEFLNANSSKIGNNYFMPYWFKQIDGNKFELLPLGKLPEGMTGEIDEMRKQIKRESLICELNTISPIVENYLISKENKKQPFEKYRGKTVIYKNIPCRVTQVPNSIIDYFEIIPERAIDDIGNGCGYGARLSEKYFLDLYKK